MPTFTHPAVLMSVDQLTMHPVTLVYDSTDPYTVRLDFPTSPQYPEDTDRVWEVSRDLLAQGLTRRVGEGDVHVHPCKEHADAVSIDFFGTATEEWARLLANRSELTGFLSSTYVLVPAGSESQYLDVDDTLRRILDAA